MDEQPKKGRKKRIIPQAFDEDAMLADLLPLAKQRNLPYPLDGTGYPKATKAQAPDREGIRLYIEPLQIMTRHVRSAFPVTQAVCPNVRKMTVLIRQGLNVFANDRRILRGLHAESEQTPCERLG